MSKRFEEVKRFYDTKQWSKKADRFKVSTDNVFKSQYSYTVVLDEDDCNNMMNEN